jgi:hypothetical protein
MTLIELQAEAELLFPFPAGACAYVRKKIIWKRDQWIKENSKTIK